MANDDEGTFSLCVRYRTIVFSHSRLFSWLFNAANKILMYVNSVDIPINSMAFNYWHRGHVRSINADIEKLNKIKLRTHRGQDNRHIYCAVQIKFY